MSSDDLTKRAVKLSPQVGGENEAGSCHDDEGMDDNSAVGGSQSARDSSWSPDSHDDLQVTYISCTYRLSFETARL